MKIRDTKVAMHRNARQSVIASIVDQVGTTIYRTRVEVGGADESENKHVWTTLCFCPQIAEAPWVVGHSSYKIEVRGRTTETAGTWGIEQWDCWNMTGLENGLKLYSYLSKNKGAAWNGNVRLDDSVPNIAQPIINPLKRADARARLACEFLESVRAAGHAGRLGDIHMQRMIAFIRGRTINRQNFEWGDDSMWHMTALSFVRTIHTDNWNLSPQLCGRLKERARVMLEEEHAA